MNFKPIDTFSVSERIFTLIDKDWMLVTAGGLGAYNTMTASWGGLGTLWSRPVAFCFVRPSRHTFSFIERENLFSLSFFPEGYRKALSYCGSHSGREVDKAHETGLKPFAVCGTVGFEQARLIFVCRKLYADFIRPENFIDQSLIDENYPSKDFHRQYVGEIVGVFEHI
jgi:flavin reductase (DIM6/NTAB) family NADH-FMN oxidoreductase RutF